jgi:hypothetical protein
MKSTTRARLLHVGAKAIVAQLAKHGVKGRDVARLPSVDPFAGEACLAVETCRAGNVLVLERPAARLPERLLQRLAGVVTRRELRAVPPGWRRDPRDRTPGRAPRPRSPTRLPRTPPTPSPRGSPPNRSTRVVASGLRIPAASGRAAFAQWRRLKGKRSGPNTPAAYRQPLGQRRIDVDRLLLRHPVARLHHHLGGRCSRAASVRANAVMVSQTVS